MRALQATLAALVLLGVIELSGEQLGGVVLAVEASMAAVGAWLSPSVPFGRVGE